MIEESHSYWARKVGVGIALAFVTFLVAFPACCGGVEVPLDRVHPSGKQNVLEAFYFAVPGAMIAAGVVFGLVMLKAYRRRRREIAEDGDEDEVRN